MSWTVYVYLLLLVTVVTGKELSVSSPCPCVQEEDLLTCDRWEDQCPHRPLPATSRLLITDSPHLRRISETNIQTKGLARLTITNTGLTELNLEEFSDLIYLDLRNNKLRALARVGSGIRELYLAGNDWSCFSGEPLDSPVFSRYGSVTRYTVQSSDGQGH